MAQHAVEIERKWLVEQTPDLSSLKPVKINQGYIVSTADSEVRLRRQEKKFFQTVKTGTGLQRGEIEIALTRKQFKKLWLATRGRRLEKVRYKIRWQGNSIELDVYRKELSGLQVAEVEFKTRKQAKAFSPPQWFSKEVTGEENYKNANLAEHGQRSTT
jgi:CYTH domain-containing protein